MNKSNNASAKSTSASAAASKLAPMSKDEAKKYAADALAKANLAYCDAIATAAVTYAVVLRSVAQALGDAGFSKAEVRAIIKEHSPASPATIKRAVSAALGRERSLRKDAGLVKYAVNNGMETLKAMVASGKKAKKAKDEGDEDGEAEGDEGEDEAATEHTVETLSNLMASLDRKLVEGAIVRWSALVGKGK